MAKNNDKVIFGLKNARKVKGETLRESAKGLGLKNHQDLARIENGEKGVDSEMLSKLSEYYGISLNQLLKEETKIVLGDIHWNYSQRF